MAYIKINHKKLESTAESIDKYVSFAKKKMKVAESEVLGLTSSWQGKDSDAFYTQFNKLNDGDSTYKKMNKSMEAYAKFLRYSAKEYQRAQEDAVNRANWLPK